jgi:uncharacterized protein (TIGR03435 family)
VRSTVTPLSEIGAASASSRVKGSAPFQLPGRRDVLRGVLASTTALITASANPRVRLSSAFFALAAEPKFDVVSIRPSHPGGGERIAFGPGADGYRAISQTIWATIMIAYYPLPNQYWADKLIGAPKWAVDDAYDIDAKLASTDMAAWQHQGPGNGMFRSMLQRALCERCNLRIHSSSVACPVYRLAVGKKGSKGLTPTKNGEVPPPNSLRMPTPDGRLVPSAGDLRIFGMSMASLAAFLTRSTDLPVFDGTHLAGLYDFTLPRAESAGGVALGGVRSFDVSALGLEVRRVSGQTPTLTIDHIEKPSPN